MEIWKKKVNLQKVKWFERTFDNFSEQKNFAISKASHDWLLFFDPDEEITSEVKEEILETLENPKADRIFVPYSLTTYMT